MRPRVDDNVHPETVTPAEHPSLLRAMLLGALLIPLNVYWVTIIEVRWATLDGTCFPLFITPIFFLFGLTLLNLLYRKIVRRPLGGLRQPELLIVYIMLVVSCTFCGEDTLQGLFGLISHPYWYASPTNRWQSLFFDLIPKWLLVTSHPALEGLYRGGVSIYSPEGRRYAASWVVPLTVWGAFFLTLVGMYLCMTVIVRRAWIHNEKLTFPLVQLPMALTADDAGATFLKNRLMWLGFGLAFGISFLNGLGTLFPLVPQFPIKLFDLHPYVTSPPWNAIGETRTSLYPFVIGIAYFMPLDLSFSCWFFYLMTRVMRVAGAASGLPPSGIDAFPYFGEQAAGAWLGLGLMLIYGGRTYYLNTIKMALAPSKSDDAPEAVRYRFAYAGLLLGGCLMTAFLAVIGMRWWVGTVFFGVVFLLGFTITRVRAEVGSPHEISWVNPGQVLVNVFGTSALGAKDLSLIATLYWFNRGYRNHPMPNQLEGFKMMDSQPVAFGKMIGVFAVASVVSLLATDWANLHVSYSAGALAKAAAFKWWVGGEAYGRLADWLSKPVPPASAGLYYILGGVLFVAFLSWMRVNVLWWPFHPAGYALAVSYAMEDFWMPILIAWGLKSLIVRYGGMRGYQAAMPFFLGLTLGDYTIGCLWTIIGAVLGIPTYRIYL